jgi:hypothetical protein
MSSILFLWLISFSYFVTNQPIKKTVPAFQPWTVYILRLQMNASENQHISIPQQV